MIDDTATALCLAAPALATAPSGGSVGGTDATVLPFRAGRGRAATRPTDDEARSRRAHPAGRGESRSGPARFAAVLVRAHGEVAAGRRPFPQLEDVLAPGLARRLAAQLRTCGPRPGDPPRVTRVLVGEPTPSGAHEATVLVDRDGRTGAVAVRIERHHGRWRATELTAPEDGYAPLPTASAPLPAGGRRDAFDEAADEAAVRAAVTPRRGSA